MQTTTRYVIDNRFEPDPYNRSTRAPALPKRVHHWSVDGPWLLAWGSDSAAEFEPPPAPKATFMHWFRREVMRTEAL